MFGLLTGLWASHRTGIRKAAEFLLIISAQDLRSGRNLPRSRRRARRLSMVPEFIIVNQQLKLCSHVRG